MGYLPEEILFVDEQILTVDRKRIESLKELAVKNKRTRVRLCTHPNADHNCHEMLIVHLKGNYIPPHKHIDKSDSIHVIEGTADLIFLDEKGEIFKVVHLGVSGSGKEFYYRISEPIYHTLIVTSDIFVFHETCKGPYDRSETVFGEWAPHEDDLEAAQLYMKDLVERRAEFTNTNAQVV